jgi:hypothetical protein
MAFTSAGGGFSSINITNTVIACQKVLISNTRGILGDAYGVAILPFCVVTGLHVYIWYLCRKDCSYLLAFGRPLFKGDRGPCLPLYRFGKNKLLYLLGSRSPNDDGRNFMADRSVVVGIVSLPIGSVSGFGVRSVPSILCHRDR